jgi:hypothetical protein
VTALFLAGLDNLAVAMANKEKADAARNGLVGPVDNQDNDSL